MSEIVLDPPDDNGKSDPRSWVEHIVFLNASTLVDDSDVSWWATLCAKQLLQDFCPLWGLPAPRVEYMPDVKDAPATAQLVVFLDKSDAPGAAAYHDKMLLDGNPYSKVFPAEGNPLVSAGHECMEMVLDPECNSWVFNPKTGLFHSLEASDAVEADTYKLDGEQVSSFLLPGFWGLPARTETPDRTGAMLLSFTGTAPGAFQTADGGYQIVKDQNGNISQVFGDARSDRRASGKRHPAARTALRIAGQKRQLRGRAT
jgi:hypothetical protein